MGEPQKKLEFTAEEFSNAVRAEAQKAVAEALAQNRDLFGTKDSGDDVSWVAKLAAELAQMNNQGPSAKLYVAPAVLAARKAARARMIDLIVAARAKGEKPRYALRNKVYLNERLIDPFYLHDHEQHRTEIDWTGVPSEAMIARNDVAKKIYAEFTASIGSKTPVQDERPLTLTPGGLVVHGAPQKRRGDAKPMDVGALEFADDLSVPHREGGRPDGHLRVLGTIHPPVQEGAGGTRGA